MELQTEHCTSTCQAAVCRNCKQFFYSRSDPKYHHVSNCTQRERKLKLTLPTSHPIQRQRINTTSQSDFLELYDKELPEEEQDEEDESDVDLYNAKISLIKFKSSVYQTDHSIQALIDGGAEVSVIKSNCSNLAHSKHHL